MSVNTTSASPPVLVTIDVIAQALSVSPRQVQLWQSQGRIPHHKFGRRCCRYSLTEVLEALGVDSPDPEPGDDFDDEIALLLDGEISASDPRGKALIRKLNLMNERNQLRAAQSEMEGSES